MRDKVKGIISFCFSVVFAVLLLVIAFHLISSEQVIKIEYECKDNILRTINHGQSGDYYLTELDENNDPVACEVKK